MIRRYSLPVFTSLALLLAVGGLGLFLFSSGPGATGGGGGPEMSSARLKWEWERLRNPKTGKIPEGIRGREVAFAATHPGRSYGAPFLKGAGIAAYDWTHRGPWNVGGRTRAVAVDVTGPDTILAGGVSGGMWRSTDAGLTWRLTTRPDQIPSVTTIVQDTRPGKTHVWYFGSGELYGTSASGGGAFYNGDGIFKSTDNGRSWFSLASTASGTPHEFNTRDNVWRLALDPSNPDQDEIYAAILGRIIRSTDGGESWTEVLRPGFLQASAYFTDVAVTSAGTVYATVSSGGGSKGIWRSDSGTKFTNITPPDMPPLYNRIVMGIAPSNENVAYFFAETPETGFLGKNFRGDSSWQSLWKYTYVSGNGTGDGGVWENRSANLPGFGGGNGDLFTQGGYDLHVKVKPDNENVVFIGGTNLYRSTDGFATSQNTSWIGGFKSWKRDSTVIEDYSYPEHHADQHDVIFSPVDPDVMYSASDGGVHMTFDCTADSVRWVSLNSGYLTTQFYTVAIDHGTAGDQTIVGGLQDNGTWRTASTDGSVPWVLTGTSDGAYCAIADGGAFLCASKQQGRVYRVDLDGNGAMTGSTRIDPAGATGHRFINPFILDPNDSKVLYLPIGRKIWRNTDITAIPLDSRETTSIGWDSLQGTDIGADRPGAEITAIAVSAASPANRLWYGDNTGRIFRADDGLGADPVAVEVTGANLPSDAFVSSIAVDPENGDVAIVAFSNYEVISLFRTTDAGETWGNISGNLEENPDGSGAGPSVRWVSILHRGGGTIYFAGTSTGLYSTTRLEGEGTVWIKEGEQTIGNSVVDMIDVRQSDGFVAVGTHGYGVWSTTVGLLGVDGPQVAGAGLELEQSYPNPMRDRATIAFTVPGSQPLPVELALYNTQGGEVAVLLRETLPPGKRTVRIDREIAPGVRLAGGTYFYRLRAGETVIAKGMQVE